MNDIRPPAPRLPRPRPPERPLQGVQSVAPPPRVAPEPAPVTPVAIDLPPPSTFGPSKQMQINQPKKRSWGKAVLITLAALLVLGIMAGAGIFFWYKDAMTPYSSSSERIKVEVASGMVPDQVATLLEQKKLIKSARALQIYLDLYNKSTVKAGNYVFSPNMMPAEMVNLIAEGKTETMKITILPGKTLAELKKSFIDYGFSAEAVDKAYAHRYPQAFLATKPAAASLEGYIYPETYFVSPETSLEDIISQSLDIFEKKIKTQELEQSLAARGFTLFQAITLASIIELEVKTAHDQRQVAQVFETRLAQGMMLGSDVTYLYAGKLLGVEGTPTLESPYNTRLHTGLPPGPISNFNINALEAVAAPNDGNFLFFVAGDDGVNHYSRTYEEHESNIKKYCLKLCVGN